MFWFVCGKIGLFPVLLHRKKVVCQFAASYFDFTWSYSKQRFCLFSAKVRCFQHYVSENRLFFFFLVKLRFWPSKTIGKHVLVCCERNWKFQTLCRKSSDLVFPRKVRSFKLHNTENMFWLVGTKFFELYIGKKSHFAFCLLKQVALTQRSVCRKVVLFPALLLRTLCHKSSHLVFRWKTHCISLIAPKISFG